MKITFHTLGCKVNQYESEAMAALFKERGHVVVGEEEIADVYIINTCTVTAEADRKSRQFARRMKKRNPDSIVVVTGCYVQIDPESVETIEGVDIITGINEKASLPEYVENYAKATDSRVWKHVREYDDLGAYEDLGTVTSTEGRTRAYIKIEDGCNRFCSYCVIPYARGKVRSRPLEEIVAEAKSLIAAGYKEIVLTGINTALYGTEKSGSDFASGIEEVIAALNELEGDFRIRLSSLEPTVVDAAYVKRLLKYERLCHHMHLSAQSGSDKVLASMNRSYSRSDYESIVKALRDFDPCYGISADIIVGFPGEDERDFNDSIGLVENCCLCKTHIFKYSRRPRTKAAEMKGQVTAADKNDRSRRLQEAAQTAAEEFFRMNIGCRRKVLVEEYLPGEGVICGYTDNYIRAYVPVEPKEAEAVVNTFIQVELVDLHRDGMLGKTVDFEHEIG